MLPEELLRKIKQIEITTRKSMDHALTGQFKSRFKGQGVQFSEHRLYVPGDDVRHIDWKVSARSRDPVVKKYEEERELSVFLVVDVSGSKSFGSTGKLKIEMAAEIACMIAYAATRAGDRVGALLFAGEVEHVVPPRKGRQHVLRLVRDILAFQPKTRGTNLAGALESTGRVMKHAGVVFVISDFLDKDYQLQLKRLARRNDVVAVMVGDEREVAVPDLGQVLFLDPESGEERLVDTSSYAFKKWLKEEGVAREQEAQSVFKGGRVDLLRVKTKDDYGEAVVRFFRVRSRRRR